MIQHFTNFFLGETIPWIQFLQLGLKIIRLLRREILIYGETVANKIENYPYALFLIGYLLKNAFNGCGVRAFDSTLALLSQFKATRQGL